MVRIKRLMTYFGTYRFAAAALAVALCASWPAAQAHKGATGIVKERMDLMTNISKRLKLVVQMIRGKRPFDGNAVAVASTAIAGAIRRYRR